MNFLSEAMFPRSFTCDICGIETFGGNICPDCLKTVTFNDKVTCPVCGRKTYRPETCIECKADLPLYKKAYSPLVYENGAAALIAKFKNGSGYLKEYFSDIMAEYLATLSDFDCIVYVPMTEKAVRKRGYNQAQLLANGLSKRLQKPIINDALIKEKDTAEQKTLSRKERAENLANCIKVVKRSEVKDKKLLLVDDILTTGATAKAVCKKLLSAGAKRIYLVTAASVEYKQPDDKNKISNNKNN
ncbi:MAG: ComF family protein [Clostridia bacterium]|nr:ComF family protein [Clostridia bacterium]